MAPDINKTEVLELFGYIKSMFTRLQNLQGGATQISNQIDSLIHDIKTRKDSLTYNLESVKQDVSVIKQDIRTIQKAILSIITQLRASVKADELERFKKRIDAWAPENLVTRREVEKVLKEL